MHKGLKPLVLTSASFWVEPLPHNQKGRGHSLRKRPLYYLNYAKTGLKRYCSSSICCATSASTEVTTTIGVSLSSVGALAKKLYTTPEAS